MDTEVMYVDVPERLKRSLENLAMHNRRQTRGPRTLTGLVVQACDDLLIRELPDYESVRVSEGGKAVSYVQDVRATQVDQIIRAVAELVLQDGKEDFSRADIRERIGVDRDKWLRSYSPTFQGMRVDQPGRAPQVGARYKGVFRQIEHGRHTLTPYGRQLIESSAS